MEKKKRRYFPDEFKRQAAERVETSGLSFMDVAAELGVHETCPTSAAMGHLI